jgi:DNA mismatch repair protein MutL
MESPGEDSPEEESTQPAVDAGPEANGLDVLQWKGTYLIVPTDGGLTMVHMRRAHMRILFEQFLVQTEASGQKVASQALLLPEQITLTKAEVMALVEAKTVLASMGMDLAQVDETTVELKAVPADLKTQVREALDAVLATYHDGLWESTENRGVLWAKAWAQQAAMSSTERLQPEARRQLIQSLWACEQPHVDPMGRSTMVTLTDTDLETPFL